MSIRPTLYLVAVSLVVTACSEVTAPEVVDDLDPSFATTPFQPGKIVYQVSEGSSWDIFSMSSDGTRQRNLTATPTVDETDPALSADGSTVAYARGGEIWTMSVSGAKQQLVYDGMASWSSQPAWSPDGSQIAFTRDNFATDLDIWVVDADGSNPMVLVGGPYDQHSPTWAADGTVTYVGAVSPVGPSYIFGSGVPSLLIGSSPAWSPDGTLLMYHKQATGLHTEQQLYVLDVTESWPIEHRVTFGSQDDTDPAWSPDGDKIAFARDVAIPGQNPRREIWWMEAGAYRAIAPLVTAPTGSDDNVSPSWGPCFKVSPRAGC